MTLRPQRPQARRCRRYTMKTTISMCVLLCLLALTSSAWCKRGGAPIVGSVLYDNIRYTVPNDDGTREYIQAWDMETQKKIWELTIYTNAIQPGLEKDVQWVFIDTMKLGKDHLLITDKRARRFLVDLKTRQIKRLK